MAPGDELVSSREMDDEPAMDPFCYLSFIHIKDILKGHWMFFSKYFTVEANRDKNKFLNTLTKVNGIRNQVMHPIKNARHTYSDFELVHSWSRIIDQAGNSFQEMTGKQNS